MLVSFENKKSPFFRALREKVDKYFTENKISPVGNSSLYLKSIIQLVSAMGLYTVLVFFTPGIAISVILCCLFGVNLALLGFNIMHDGGHQSFSKHTWLNKASAHSLNLMGGSAYFWKIKHNINHHTYTNIEGMDEDMEIDFFMRLHDNQPRYWFHRFQHIYWIVLYGLTYFLWVFKNDFDKYFKELKSDVPRSQKQSPREHVLFWVTKVGYGAVYILLPILMVGWLKWLVGFAIVTFVCGLTISIVFQLAHIVESTQFPAPNVETNKIENEWAIHQLNTTANFGTNSKLLFWLLGGLNFQVEHHLFPKISHIHYPAISRLVRETAEQFNVPYNNYPTAYVAIRSHG